MSELSEEAYSAGWMDGLDYALWEATQGQRSQCGRLVFTELQREQLRSLSERAGSWIMFDDQRDEIFPPLKERKNAYAKTKGEHGGFP